MILSVKVKGVTQPAIVRPREDVAMRLSPATAARRPASLQAMQTCRVSSAT